MSSFNVNANAMLELLKKSAQYTTTENIWLKLPAGLHQIRFCPPWSAEGTPTRMILQHGEFKDKEGNKKFPLCYQYVFDNIKPIAEILMAKNLIKQNDVEVFKQMGCIFCRTSDIVRNTNGKANNKAFAKKAFFWNVINRGSEGNKDGKCYIWRTSDSAFKNISMFFSAYPNLFNVDNGLDFMLTAEKDGMQRRYSYNIINNPCPLNYDPSKIHNLDDAMGEGYRNMDEAIELIMNTYPNMLQLLGINPAQVMQGTGAPF